MAKFDSATRQAEHEQINQRVMSTVTVNKAHAEWFKPILSAWLKPWGSKPTAEMLTAAVLLTNKHKRPGVECLHIAMCWRPEGCTVKQYTNAGCVGLNRVVGAANNKRKALIGARLFTEFTTDVDGASAYKLTFTGNGEKALAAEFSKLAAADQPADKPKPKGKAKAKKAPKAPKAETPTSEAPTVTEQQPVVVGADTNAQPFEQVSAPEAVEIGGVDPDHDVVTQADLSALAQHFNG